MVVPSNLFRPVPVPAPIIMLLTWPLIISNDTAFGAPMVTKGGRGLPVSASTVYSPSVIKRPIRFNDRINEPRRLIRDPRVVRVLYKRTHTLTLLLYL